MSPVKRTKASPAAEDIKPMKDSKKAKAAPAKAAPKPKTTSKSAKSLETPQPTPKAAKKEVEPKEIPSKAAPTPAPSPETKTENKAQVRKSSARSSKAAQAIEPPVKQAPPPKDKVPASKTQAPESIAAPAPQPASGYSLSPVAQIVLQAIREGQAVEFLFKDAETNPPRTFEPRQLLFDVFTQAWFAWGWDRRYNAERHHCLDLLEEANLVDGVGRAAQGPFPENTPANRIGGWLGGEPIPVKAILQKQWIFAVKQSPAPFPEFKLQDLEDGKAQVSFSGTDLRAIARWCMQFGDGLQVLEPQRLVDRIRQVGTVWAGRAADAPSNGGPKSAPRPDHRPDSKPEPRSDHRREPAPEARRFEAKPESLRPEPTRPDPEPRHRSEPRPEPKLEHRRPEPRREESRREDRDKEKAKGTRVEVRFERL